MPFDDRIALLVAVTGALPGELRQDPTLRDTPAHLAQQVQDIRQQLPRKESETNPAWARRIYETVGTVRVMVFDDRIALLAAVTGVLPRKLRRDPTLRDTPAHLTQQVRVIKERLPRKESETSLRWARRIYGADPTVRAMVVDGRMALLAAVTGATEASLRQDPTLRDTPAHLAQQAEEIRDQLPREPDERAAAWARRIYQADATVRTMAVHDRIALLAAVTGARQGNLRQEPTLQDTPADLAQ